jgi:stress-induced morphogen
MNIEDIKKHLLTISQFEISSVIDNSQKHKHHSGVLDIDSNLTHIEIHVFNKNSMTRVDIHRAIYEKLDLFIKSGLHSIEIKILN